MGGLIGGLIGGLEGDTRFRGQTTRLMSISSGIHTWLKTRKTKVDIIMDINDNIRINVSSLDDETLPKVYFRGRCIYNPTKNKQQMKGRRK